MKHLNPKSSILMDNNCDDYKKLLLPIQGFCADKSSFHAVFGRSMHILFSFVLTIEPIIFQTRLHPPACAATLPQFQLQYCTTVVG
jgi:hypothetical protein